jgi:hypothetical protein
LRDWRVASSCELKSRASGDTAEASDSGPTLIRSSRSLSNTILAAVSRVQHRQLLRDQHKLPRQRRQCHRVTVRVLNRPSDTVTQRRQQLTMIITPRRLRHSQLPLPSRLLARLHSTKIPHTQSLSRRKHVAPQTGQTQQTPPETSPTCADSPRKKRCGYKRSGDWLVTFCAGLKILGFVLIP